MTDVVIIGAGMSGIACARTLQSAGVPVRLIDKGRGIGGRVATRRAEVEGQSITFDHGAQYLDQSEEASRIAELVPEATGIWRLSEGVQRLVGIPEMSSVPKTLARGLDVTLDTRVTTVRDSGTHWHIDTDSGHTTASHLIITVPAPQLAPILGETHGFVEQSVNATMLPCMTLMAAFDRDISVPFGTRRNVDEVLTWIARNDLKPNRSSEYQTWVAQAHPDWSAERIDADRAETKAAMVELLCDALNVASSTIRHAGLQGWRYGLVAKPLGQPFLSERTIWAGGDWCCGPKVQDAWRSGVEIARSVLKSG